MGIPTMASKKEGKGRKKKHFNRKRKIKRSFSGGEREGNILSEGKKGGKVGFLCIFFSLASLSPY